MMTNYKGIAYLRRKLLSKRSRVETRYRYYEMKDFHQPRNLMVPADLQNKFKFTLGWCTKAVDSMADRLRFRGFKNDNFNMQQIFEMNNSDILYDSAILGALITSCNFIYIQKMKQDFHDYKLSMVVMLQASWTLSQACLSKDMQC